MNDSDKPMRHSDPPTLDDHPGLDNDEATDEGKMMTASGSLGPVVDDDDEAEERDEHAEERRAERSTQPRTDGPW